MNKEGEPLAECLQIFKRIEQKIDARSAHTDELLAGLIQRADRINGRYEKHIKESTEYRRKVDKHEHTLDSLEKAATKAMQERLNTTKAAQWRIGLIVAVSMSLLTIMAQGILRLVTG